MPKETNLNVAPYFDDFTPDSNYYKVLYKLVFLFKQENLQPCNLSFRIRLKIWVIISLKKVLK